MLDTLTKKRIDDCRDILVGKLPDPKAQIEQITIGLIYKFMDDMDKEAIELGGKAKFFSNYEIPDPQNPGKTKTVEFEKYRWDHLFDAKVTATEMLTLYSEAITEMDKNPNIPALFRDIFKNAFLPYRDPETLRLFLGTIGLFDYSHSEKLGDAFEYLLSVMGSQGDAGQFRTPRHIIDFLVEIVDPGKNDTILDPACGTAGFLISAFKHIKKKNNNELTPDEQKKLIQNFVGYDISPDMVRLSLVNLYLHGFSDPHIHEYDTLSSEVRWNENYDVILANPPFMSPKGGIRPHKKFTISSNRSEVLFIDYIAEHLNPKGRAGIIVPEGIIFQSGKAYKELRKMLVENYLYAVVSLPPGVFNPYSGVKTSILLMDKEIAKQKDEVLFVKIDNDGFSLGAQRNEIQGSQLEEAVAVISEFCSGKSPLEEETGGVAHVVPKTKVAENGDYNLSGERYKMFITPEDNIEWVEIGDTVKLIKDGDWVESKDQSESGIRLIQTGNIGIGEFKKRKNKSRYISEETFKELNCIEVFPNDVLVSRLPDPVGRACLVPSLKTRMITAVDCSIIRFDENMMLPTLFVYYSKIDRYYNHIAPFLTGSSRRRISRKNLEKVKIPLPPLSVQEEIVAEIEGYQKIIDGAKEVVENYKPKIDIDPDWEMVELGEVCEVKSGGTPDRKNGVYWNGDIPYVKTGEIFFNRIKHAEEFITEEGLNNSSARLISPGTILMAMYGQGVTRGRVAILEVEVAINQAVAAISCNDKIDNEFLFYQLMGLYEHLRMISDARGGNQSNLNGKLIKELKIVVPNFETQRQVVAQIEKEQELVNANKQLIEIFEQKIKDRIAKVWGEDSEDEGEI